LFAGAVGALLITLPASAQVTSETDGRVSVIAENAPLAQLLRQLATLTPMVLRVDPAVEGRPVTVRLEHVAIEEAIATIVRESGVDFVAVGLQRRNASTPIHLVAGDDRRAVQPEARAEPQKDRKADVAMVGLPPPQAPEESYKPPKDPAAAALAGAAAQETQAADAAAHEAQAKAFSEEIQKVLLGPGPRDTPLPPGGQVMLPFANPDGSPVMVVPIASPTAPTRSPLPGVPPATKPPGL